jgi:hypothetical protein
MTASIKIAFGLLTIHTVVDCNSTVKELVKRMRELVTSRFNVEPDAQVQIIHSVGKPNSELEIAVPEVEIRVADYFNEDDFLFYAKITRKFQNIDYIKTDLDNRGVQRACYMKKDDLEELRRGRTIDQIRCFTETELVPEPEPEPEECSICRENQVNTVGLFRCNHLFCNLCNARWSQNAAVFNCPLCRC